MYNSIPDSGEWSEFVIHSVNGTIMSELEQNEDTLSFSLFWSTGTLSLHKWSETKNMTNIQELASWNLSDEWHENWTRGRTEYKNNKNIENSDFSRYLLNIVSSVKTGAGDSFVVSRIGKIKFLIH